VKVRTEQKWKLFQNRFKYMTQDTSGC